MSEPKSNANVNGKDELKIREANKESAAEKRQNAREHDEPNPDQEDKVEDPPVEGAPEIEKQEFPQEKKPVKKVDKR